MPFAEVSKVMELVLKEWHEKLICPYSDRLRWEKLGSSQLERLFPKPLDEPSDNNPPHADALLWNGFPKTDSVQKRYRCNWKKLDDNSFCYVPCKSTRVYSPEDVVVSWDRTPCAPYAITTTRTKNLSVVSKRGTTEEIARELMMDFLFGLVVTLNDEDLNRVYKMTFRLDEETGKESDFGVEITVKGCIDDIVESWDRQRIMTYARSRGWNRSLHALEEAETLWTDQALREMTEGMFCGNDNSEFDSRLIFRDRIKRTVLIRALYNSISSLPSYFWSRDTSEELEEEDEARLAFIAKFDEIISKS